MKRWYAAFAALALATAASAQSHHDPRYIVGGALPSNDTTITQGIQLLDMTTPSAPSMAKLFQPGFTSRFVMDRDNIHVLFTAQGSSSTNSLYSNLRGGMFRYNTKTGRISTVTAPAWSATTGYESFYHAEVDHDGDYVVGNYDFDRLNPQNSGYRLLRVSPAGVSTTIIGPNRLGRPTQFTGQIGRNILTGNMLVCDLWQRTSPSTLVYPILEVDTDTGLVFTFHNGAGHGWYGFWSLPQNHRTGDIEGPWGTRVFRIRPGNQPRSTVTVLPGLPTPIYGGTEFDLQTAASPQMVATSFTNAPRQTYFFTIDPKTWSVTATRTSPTLKTDGNGLAFYRGRHTQTLITGQRKWQVRLSAPNHPNKGYAVAVGFSGLAPGIKLPDGRNINLNLDAAAILSLRGQLMPFFDPGPNRLDQNGEAIAILDAKLLGGRIGIPCWIAWIVIDPAAPGGIALIPDTYVMRL